MLSSPVICWWVEGLMMDSTVMIPFQILAVNYPMAYHIVELMPELDLHNQGCTGFLHHDSLLVQTVFLQYNCKCNFLQSLRNVFTFSGSIDSDLKV